MLFIVERAARKDASFGILACTGGKGDVGKAKFEVMDMDGRRVDKVLVTTLPQRASTHEEGNGKK